jgi:hypothetical protein
MIKTKKKLNVNRETLVVLSTHVLHDVQAGNDTTTRDSAAPVKCEPSGIIACTA